MASNLRAPRRARVNINSAQKRKKARWPSGHRAGRTVRSSGISLGSPDGFAPIQGVWPGPRTWRLVQPIAGTDKIVGGSKVVGGIRHHRVPTDLPGARFQRTHQAQLKATAAMPFEYADAAKISRVMGIR